MSFWLSMTACVCIVPLIQIVAGFMMYKHCPKKINNFIGYRTKRSKLSLDTWRFAHRFCGALWLVTGIVMAPAGVAVLFLLKGSATQTIENIAAITALIQLLPLLFSVAATEIKLKKVFNDDGTIKQDIK